MITVRHSDGRTEKLDLVNVNVLKDKFSPLKNENVFFDEQNQMLSSLTRKVTDLDNLIKLLTMYRDKFGNMPIVNFHGREGTFTKPTLTDIDVVRQYFTVSGNTKDVFMNIHDEKALSWFTF